MNKEILLYAGISAFGVFISALSQVLLKKAAMKKYVSVIQEYFNPSVVIAYSIFLIATFLSVYAYKVIPVSMGPLLDATSYIYVSIFGALFFQEKFSAKKIAAIGLIILGICIYSLLG